MVTPTGKFSHNLHLMNILIHGRRESSILPEDLANQSVRIKEEQLRKEEEKVSIAQCLPSSRSSERATNVSLVTLASKGAHVLDEK